MRAVAPEQRGYAVLYRAPQICPGCSRGHWLVGRSLAECANCGTALALAPSQPEPPVLVREGWL